MSCGKAGREVCFGSFGNVQLLRESVPPQEPAALPEGISAKQPGRRSLMEAQQEQGELPELCLIQDLIQENVPGHLMLPSSQALLLQPSNPHPARHSRYLSSPRSFLLSLWCRSHFHLPLLFSCSSTFTTSFSWPEGTPELSLGGRGTWGALGPALLQVGLPGGAQGFVQSLCKDGDSNCTGWGLGSGPGVNFP